MKRELRYIVIFMASLMESVGEDIRWRCGEVVFKQDTKCGTGYESVGLFRGDS